MTPPAPASRRLWQRLQDGCACSMNTCRPSARRASPASACTIASRLAKTNANLAIDSDHHKADGMILPAIVAVAALIIQALLGLHGTLGIDRPASQGVAPRLEFGDQHERPPGEGPQIRADEARHLPVLASVQGYFDPLHRPGSTERHTLDPHPSGLGLLQRLGDPGLDAHLPHLRLI